jgi:hypothetical protein
MDRAEEMAYAIRHTNGYSRAPGRDMGGVSPRVFQVGSGGCVELLVHACLLAGRNGVVRSRFAKSLQGWASAIPSPSSKHKQTR